MRHRRVGLLVAAAVVAPAAVGAQSYAFVPRVQAEFVAGLVGGSVHRAALGIGANVPADYPVRIGVTAMAAPALASGDPSAVRVEAVARFLADPFHETRWGAYAGAGLGLTMAERDHGRAALVVVVGAELPGRLAWRPAVELGIGDGVRAQLVLRRARRNGR